MDNADIKDIPRCITPPMSPLHKKNNLEDCEYYKSVIIELEEDKSYLTNTISIQQKNINNQIKANNILKHDNKKQKEIIEVMDKNIKTLKIDRDFWYTQYKLLKTRFLNENCSCITDKFDEYIYTAEEGKITENKGK